MIADNKQMFIMCDCNSHGIVVDKIFDEDVCISLFELSLRGRKLNFSKN